jgi:hypothetical protein
MWDRRVIEESPGLRGPSAAAAPKVLPDLKDCKASRGLLVRRALRARGVKWDLAVREASPGPSVPEGRGERWVPRALRALEGRKVPGVLPASRVSQACRRPTSCSPPGPTESWAPGADAPLLKVTFT